MRTIISGILFTLLSGCAGHSWEPYNTLVKGYPDTGNDAVFRNIVYFQNNSPYCEFRISSTEVSTPQGKDRIFNPVKEDITLTYGGEKRFIEYNFNINNQYATPFFWYKNGRYISQGELSYDIVRTHMGEQYITLDNREGECRRPSRR